MHTSSLYINPPISITPTATSFSLKTPSPIVTLLTSIVSIMFVVHHSEHAISTQKSLLCVNFSLASHPSQQYFIHIETPMAKRKANFSGSFIGLGWWGFFQFTLQLRIPKGLNNSNKKTKGTFTSCEDHKWASTSKPLNPLCISCHQIFIGLGVEAGQSCPHTSGWAHYIALGPVLAWIKPG